MTNQLLPDDPTAETLIEQRRSRSIMPTTDERNANVSRWRPTPTSTCRWSDTR